MIDKDGRSQKIKSYFINEKIPSEERDCVPLIADEKQIIWILGYRMSSACQITVQTHRVLEIKVTEEKSDVREDYPILLLPPHLYMADFYISEYQKKKLTKELNFWGNRSAKTMKGGRCT